jgi:hypothetical protein
MQSIEFGGQVEVLSRDPTGGDGSSTKRSNSSARKDRSAVCFQEERQAKGRAARRLLCPIVSGVVDSSVAVIQRHSLSIEEADELRTDKA